MSRRTSLDTRAGVAYPGAVVRAYQVGTTMKKLAAVLVLCIAGVTQAGEKDIVERLKKAGAIIERNNWGEEKDVLMVDFDHSKSTDNPLADLCELPKLRFLSLGGFRRSPLTDSEMHAVGGLKGLKFLQLGNCDITDAGLNELKNLTQLQFLSFYGTPVSDAGVARLQKALPKCSLHR